MYNVLIVDDEYQARCGLRDLFPWEETGMRVCADAEDGEDALPLLSSLKPDILLTDVRMNRMDGIALAHAARELLPDITIVFISGYSDVEYLRDALHVEALDYLYKPIRLGQLRELMERIRKRLDERGQVQYEQEQAQRLLEKSKPLLVERFLRSWFDGMLDDEQTIRSRLALLSLDFPVGQPYCALSFQLEWDAFPDNAGAVACQLTLERMISQRIMPVLICAEDSGLTALAGEEACSETVLLSIAEDIHTMTGVQLTIGISAPHEALTDVPTAVRQAQEAIARQTYPSHHRLLTYQGGAEDIGSTFSVSLDTDLLSRHLLSGNHEAIQQMVEGTLKFLPQTVSGARQAKKVLILFALQIDLILEQRGLEKKELFSFCQRAMGHMSVPAVRSALLNLLAEICRQISDQKSQAYSSAVQQALHIINERYADRLYVEQIAEAVHYSPAHLSVLFRQETGMTLGDALLRTRLRNAMDLLRATSLPVSAIAQQTGYPDVQYFSRTFKQHTGLTPLEYRRKAL